VFVRVCVFVRARVCESACVCVCVKREREREKDLLCGKLIDAGTKVAFFIEGEGCVVI
jgi:hypothetical protein